MAMVEALEVAIDDDNPVRDRQYDTGDEDFAGERREKGLDLQPRDDSVQPVCAVIEHVEGREDPVLAGKIEEDDGAARDDHKELEDRSARSRRSRFSLLTSVRMRMCSSHGSCSKSSRPRAAPWHPSASLRPMPRR